MSENMFFFIFYGYLHRLGTFKFILDIQTYPEHTKFMKSNHEKSLNLFSNLGHHVIISELQLQISIHT